MSPEKSSGIIHLKHPIEVPGGNGEEVERITTLHLQRLKAKHMRRLPPELFTRGEGEELSPEVIRALPDLVAALTGISSEAADELDMEDLMEAAEKLVNFLEASLGSTDGGS